MAIVSVVLCLIYALDAIVAKSISPFPMDIDNEPDSKTNDNQGIFTLGFTIGIAAIGTVILILIIIVIILVIRCRHRSRQRTSPINEEGLPVDSKEIVSPPRNSSVHQYVNVDVKTESAELKELSSKQSTTSLTNDQSFFQDANQNSVVEYDSFDDDDDAFEDDVNSAKESSTDSDESDMGNEDDDDDGIYKNEVLVRLVNSVSNRKNKQLVDLKSDQKTPHGSTETIDSYEKVELKKGRPTSKDVIREINDSLVNAANVVANRKSKELADNETDVQSNDESSSYSNKVLLKRVDVGSNRNNKDVIDDRGPCGSIENLDSYGNVDVEGADLKAKHCANSNVFSGKASKMANRKTHDGTYYLESYENVDINNEGENLDGNDKHSREKCLKPSTDVINKRRKGVKPQVSPKPAARHTIHDTACYDGKYEEVKGNPTKINGVKFKVVSKKGVKPALTPPTRKGTTSDKIAFFNKHKEITSDSGDNKGKGRVDNKANDKSNISVKYAEVSKNRKYKAKSENWD